MSLVVIYHSANVNILIFSNDIILCNLIVCSCYFDRTFEILYKVFIYVFWDVDFLLTLCYKKRVANCLISMPNFILCIYLSFIQGFSIRYPDDDVLVTIAWTLTFAITKITIYIYTGFLYQNAFPFLTSIRGVDVSVYNLYSYWYILTNCNTCVLVVL